jgi:hypothetical protein
MCLLLQGFSRFVTICLATKFSPEYLPLSRLPHLRKTLQHINNKHVASENVTLAIFDHGIGNGKRLASALETSPGVEAVAKQQWPAWF